MLTSLIALIAFQSPLPSAVESVISAGMKATGTRGLAYAMVRNGKVECVKTYGVRNAAGDPLEPDTIMYGASLTKAVFAYALMSLVESRTLDLDRPLWQYLPRSIEAYVSPENESAFTNFQGLAQDPRWPKLTARHCLTHTTGFANFAFLEPDERLHFHFEPGTRYGYSGDGIILLQFVLQVGLGIDVKSLVQKQVFDPFQMTRTSLVWKSEFDQNYADGFKADGSIQPHSRRKRVRLAGSMDTTIEDLARLAAGVSQGQGLKRRIFDEMTRANRPITTQAQFPTLAEPPKMRPYPRLNAGLGVVTFDGPLGPGFYKGGHDDGTANQWVTVKRNRSSVVLLSNDVRAEALFPAIVRASLGETGLPWEWEYPGLKFYANP
jgi:CubicO group peptidase (beta-lactamase class C family)